MLLIVPSLGGDFTVVDVASSGSAATPAASVATAKIAVDEAFGKPFSQLPQDTQKSLLAKLPSSMGGLAVGSLIESERLEGGIADAVKDRAL